MFSPLVGKTHMRAGSAGAAVGKWTTCSIVGEHGPLGVTWATGSRTRSVHVGCAHRGYTCTRL